MRRLGTIWLRHTSERHAQSAIATSPKSRPRSHTIPIARRALHQRRDSHALGPRLSPQQNSTRLRGSLRISPARTQRQRAGREAVQPALSRENECSFEVRTPDGVLRGSSTGPILVRTYRGPVGPRLWAEIVVARTRPSPVVGVSQHPQAGRASYRPRCSASRAATVGLARFAPSVGVHAGLSVSDGVGAGVCGVGPPTSCCSRAMPFDLAGLRELARAG